MFLGDGLTSIAEFVGRCSLWKLMISAILSDTEGVSKGFEEFSFIAVRRTVDAAAHACGQHAMSSETRECIAR